MKATAVGRLEAGRELDRLFAVYLLENGNAVYLPENANLEPVNWSGDLLALWNELAGRIPADHPIRTFASGDMFGRWSHDTALWLVRTLLRVSGIRSVVRDEEGHWKPHRWPHKVWGLNLSESEAADGVNVGCVVEPGPPAMGKSEIPVLTNHNPEADVIVPKRKKKAPKRG